MGGNILRRPFRRTYSNVTLWLIGINVIVFALQQLVGPRVTGALAMMPAMVYSYHAYWQFVTYMFAHGGFTHILFNMLALYIFGMPLERYLGSREFLVYYLVTGVLAVVMSFGLYMLTGAYYVALLGASGALFAVQLAYAAFFPDSVISIWGILPLRAPVMVIGFTAIELFSSVFGVRNGVAHATHLFGFGFGYLYFLVRWGRNPWRMMFGR
jgi:membrane associated rhomboid family serine protease